MTVARPKVAVLCALAGRGGSHVSQAAFSFSQSVPGVGHAKIESTIRYLGVDVEDALVLAEGTEV